MRRKIKYIHVGYPKCASKSLQYDFFLKHPQIFHLGYGAIHEPTLDIRSRYCNDEIAQAIEVDILCKKDVLYDENRVRQIFERHFDEFYTRADVRACGISQELISMSLFPYNIDNAQKALRLHRIFGDETKIIIIIREQLSLLKSLYGELIRSGLFTPYSELVDSLFSYQCSSFLSDLLYSEVYTTYCSLFGADNVFLGLFEEFKESSTVFQEKLCDFLEIDDVSLIIEHKNKSQDPIAMKCLRHINRFSKFHLGNSTYQNVLSNRLTPYFKSELGMAIPEKVAMDMERKKFNFRLAKRAAKVIKVTGAHNLMRHKTQPDLSGAQKEALSNMFSTSNRTLAELTGKNLASFGYIVSPDSP